MNAVALIPARKGSKRLPGKNRRPFCGKPLIWYTVQAAKESGCFANIVISTDDEAIIEFLRGDAVCTVLPRPAALAGDEVPMADVVLHALEELEKRGRTPDVITLLQPTSPLRTAEDIKQAVYLFQTHRPRVASVVSVCPANPHPAWMFRLRDDGCLAPWDASGLRSGYQRQRLEPVYALNGAIYITDVETFRREKTFFVDPCLPYVMPRERSVDIDDEGDFAIAEYLCQRMREGKRS